MLLLKPTPLAKEEDYVQHGEHEGGKPAWKATTAEWMDAGLSQFWQSFNRDTWTPALARAGVVRLAKDGDEIIDNPQLSVDEIKERYGDLIPKPFPMGRLQAEAIATFQAEYQDQQEAIDRLPDGAGKSIGQFAVGLLPQLVAPENYFFPFMAAKALKTATGIAKSAPLLSNLASPTLNIIEKVATKGAILAETGTLAQKMGVGAASGALGNLAVEPALYLANQETQTDYTLYDSLASVALGGVIGGAMPALGSVFRKVSPRTTSKINQAIAKAIDEGQNPDPAMLENILRQDRLFALHKLVYGEEPSIEQMAKMEENELQILLDFFDPEKIKQETGLDFNRKLVMYEIELGRPLTLDEVQQMKTNNFNEVLQKRRADLERKKFLLERDEELRVGKWLEANLRGEEVSKVLEELSPERAKQTFLDLDASFQNYLNTPRRDRFKITGRSDATPSVPLTSTQLKRFRNWYSRLVDRVNGFYGEGTVAKIDLSDDKTAMMFFDFVSSDKTMTPLQSLNGALNLVDAKNSRPSAWTSEREKDVKRLIDLYKVAQPNPSQRRAIASLEQKLNQTKELSRREQSNLRKELEREFNQEELTKMALYREHIDEEINRRINTDVEAEIALREQLLKAELDELQGRRAIMQQTARPPEIEVPKLTSELDINKYIAKQVEDFEMSGMKVDDLDVDERKLIAGLEDEASKMGKVLDDFNACVIGKLKGK